MDMFSFSRIKLIEPKKLELVSLKTGRTERHFDA